MIRGIGIIFILVLLASFTSVDWGFYGHKKINKMAVFTLPQDMLPFYKTNIEYISQHAVDPDKRRYALKDEFARHYIDIDHWDTIPFNNVPRELSKAVMKYGEMECHIGKDTTQLLLNKETKAEFYKELLYMDRYSSDIVMDYELTQPYLSSENYNVSACEQIVFQNRLIQYGALPYFLEDFYYRLVRAFENRDAKRVLKISADIGHYISDGHVPLHTTLNYNGQLTNQVGIHALWESRLPELYADDYYEFIVGQADYISDIRSYIWEFIEESHSLLDMVLVTEKELSKTFPEDQQFCFDERLGQTIWVQCPEYCEKYHELMGGIVEQRMQDAVHAVGSFWYSAWIEAGQPDLTDMDGDILLDEKEQEALNNAYRSGEIKGRKHNEE